MFANTGVVIGLVVLIYEVNQSNTYAQAESASVSSGFAFDRETAVVGENASIALAKAIDDSSGLSTQELVVIDAYHRQFLMEINNEAYQAELGILTNNWEENWGPYIRIHLDYPFGRKWWSHHRQRMIANATPSIQRVVRVIDRALSEDTNERQEFFQSMKSGS